MFGNSYIYSIPFYGNEKSVGNLVHTAHFGGAIGIVVTLLFRPELL